MAFLQSVERHILRNFVFLHAIENGLPLPIGTQDAELLDSRHQRRRRATYDPHCAELPEDDDGDDAEIDRSPGRRAAVH